MTRSMWMGVSFIAVAVAWASWEGLAGFSGAAAAQSMPAAAGAGVAGMEDAPHAELADLQAPLVLGSRQLARIAAVTMPTVVHIQSERRGRTGTVEETGSGVLMKSPKTSHVFVVTNRHVVADAAMQSIDVRLHDGRVIHPLSREEDIATDVAVLKLGEADLPVGRWGDSDNLDIGHMVMAVGSPFGLSQSVTLGIISAKGRRALQLGETREVINQDFLQTDAAINPGNSGGPLVDLQGRVVGINTAIASQGGGNEGIGFSIPVNLVRYVVDQLVEHGRVQRAYLGVRLDDSFDDVVAKRFSLDRARGARVLQIYPDTPAERAGIQIDDIILNFDGYDIEDEEHLIHRVSLTQVNKVVRVIVLRRSQRTTLEITLTDRPESNARGAAPAVPQLLPSSEIIEKTGLTLHRLDDGLARQLGYRTGRGGVLVMETGSPADNGLQLYDVIIEAARTPVATAADFDRLLADHPSREPLVLKIRRVVDGVETERLVVWPRSDAAESP